MRRGVMQFKAFGQTTRLGRWEHQIEVRQPMGIEIVLNQADFGGVGLAHVSQPLQTPRIIHRRPAPGDFDRPIAR